VTSIEEAFDLIHAEGDDWLRVGEDSVKTTTVAAS
jgi:hypothetical protein